MAKQRRPKPGVREPLQVYLTGEERALLDRLAEQLGLSRAEVLRRGIRAIALEQEGGQAGPVFRLLSALCGEDWPADVAEGHDQHLAEAHREQ